jgi:hypothetical protein
MLECTSFFIEESPNFYEQWQQPSKIGISKNRVGSATKKVNFMSSGFDFQARS